MVWKYRSILFVHFGKQLKTVGDHLRTYVLTWLFVTAQCITRGIDLTVILYTVDLSRTHQGATWSDIISGKTDPFTPPEQNAARLVRLSERQVNRGHDAEVNPLRIYEPYPISQGGSRVSKSRFVSGYENHEQVS